MKASTIRRTKQGIAITPEIGKPLAIDATAIRMILQRQRKRKYMGTFTPNNGQPVRKER